MPDPLHADILLCSHSLNGFQSDVATLDNATEDNFISYGTVQRLSLPGMPYPGDATYTGFSGNRTTPSRQHILIWYSHCSGKSRETLIIEAPATATTHLT